MADRHTTYLKRIQRFIKRPNVKFLIHGIPIKNEHGFCLTYSNPKDPILIILDPRKEFIPTLIHECLHGMYPKYKERKVKTLEAFIMKRITSNQVVELLRTFSVCAHQYNLYGKNIKDLLSDS